ncbi:MAG: ankyrin repeat domain-containing protein [Helicobacteraceae bacterium]|nr:ankyrin repeat domain-containing protein [Helicobacteraceae bacterium]
MNEWIKLLTNNDYLGAKKYIKDGADLNEANESEESVLAIALRLRCDSELIMLLVESGANIYEFDDQGVSIFDNAITYNNIVLFEYILEQGIDVSKTDRRSRFTPLMAATCYGRAEMVKKLLDSGVDKEAVEDKGLTAKDFARKMNKKSILKLL